ncbi:MAG: UDP-N-acetylglucosamine--N-acetylmuramyl-(pentapeptide) pyrophosphoryl-undecaprenol N-acetylglucosamine transferase [Gemmatimonadota bacterium]
MTGARVLLAGGGTGGHLYPALNLAAALQRAIPAVCIRLVGAERGIESSVLPDAGYPYDLLPMEPLYRSGVWRNWRLFRSVPAVASGLIRILRSFDPQLVVGTGGYASGPAVGAALATRRRTAIQEQNAEPGLVTRVLASRVDQVHLGYPEAQKRLRLGRRTRVFTYGNPVAAPGSPVRDPFSWPSGRVVAVIGGSQGARGINEALLRDLQTTEAAWPEDVHIVWVTGRADHARIATQVASLERSGKIQVVPFIPDLGSQLGSVTLAVSRAGAMFVSELAAAGVPALLVPLPTAAADHQTRNAEALSAAGAAHWLPEVDLEQGVLWDEVQRLLRDGSKLEAMSSAMRARGRPHAADRIAGELATLLVSGRPDDRG